MILSAYTAPTGASTAFVADAPTVIEHGSLCNRSAGTVLVTVEISAPARAASVVQGAVSARSARAVSGYPLAPNDTLALTDYLASARLETGDTVSVTTNVANAVDVILSGVRA